MNKPGKTIILILLAALALSACGGNKAVPTPTIDAGPIETAAVETFALGLTSTALAMPTNTPTFTPSNTPTVSTPLASATGIVPTVSCYGLTLVTDVTIPDNTPMNQGEAFVKTWRVQNTGTCTWDAGFKFLFTVGDSMSGKPFVLTTPVIPGANLDISISMTAPLRAGSIVGHWRMSTASGTLFGADIYVKITVSNGTATPTATATATMGVPTNTATPTATSTP